MLIVPAVLLAAAFSGCNEDDFSIANKKTEEVTTAVTTEVTTQSTAAETEKEKETEKSAEITEKVNTADDENNKDENENLKKELFSVFQKYSEIDSIKATSAAFLKKDRDDEITENGYEYIHVTSDNFSSVDELKNYVSQFISGDEMDNFNETSFSSDVPTFIDRDGKLYCIDGGRGSGFNFLEDTIKIYDVKEDSLKAEIDYNNFGEDENDKFYAEFELKGDKWCISKADKFYSNN